MASTFLRRAAVRIGTVAALACFPHLLAAEALPQPTAATELRGSLAAAPGSLSGQPGPIVEVLQGTFANGAALGQAGAPLRGVVNLYDGIHPTFATNGFWSFGNQVYWALDDGRMGLAAQAAGGGTITAYQFTIGLHADFAGDTIQPAAFVTFWNAPDDPVGDALDPVVEPATPVSSLLWIFNPVTLPAVGNYALTSPVADLAAIAEEFDLDDTFYFEIIPVEWDDINEEVVLDPDVYSVFTGPGALTYGQNQDRMWSDIFVYNPNFSPSDGDGFYDHPAEMDLGGGPTFLSRGGLRLFGTECDSANKLVLSILEPDDVCVQPGETVSVTLSQECLPGLVRGFQAFLEFDPTRLIFGSGLYNVPLPYGLPILTPIAAVGANIDLAAGINDFAGQVPTSSSAELVVLSFTAGATEGLTQVVFRPHDPPTRFSDPFGGEVVPALTDSPFVCIDGTPPSLTCPADLPLQCVDDVPAAATDVAELVDQGGSASDGGCGGGFVFEHVGDVINGVGCPDDPYVVERTYRATDCAGNVTDCLQTITVIDDTGPVLTCPIDTSVECTESTDPSATGMGSAIDNCDGAPVIDFDDSSAPGACAQEQTITRTWSATDACGNVTYCDQIVEVVDTTAPTIACPADVTIDCTEFAVVYQTPPGILLGQSVGGVGVYYNDNGGGENPANQAYLRAQAAYGNTNGGVFDFDATPLPPYGLFSWYDLFQVHAGQFGLDMILPAPTWDGITPIPSFIAKDNVNGSCAGATSSGAVTWAISGYSPGGGAGCAVNSLFRSAGLNPLSVGITQYDLSLAGTVYTAEVAGYLVTDGMIHWYTPATPHTPVGAFGLTGVFFFDGTLQYDSAGDPGTDLIDFYEGTMTIYANSPVTSVGVATTGDNCDPLPTVTFADVFTPAPALCHTGSIARTWTSTDACGNATSCLQTITVEDTAAPVLTMPADITVPADAGGCDATLNPGLASAEDDCDANPALSFVRSDGKLNLTDPYEVADSPITIEWTAMDCAGNSASETQTITVQSTTNMLVSIELDGVVAAGPFDRCITFELWECPDSGPSATVEATMSFVAGAASAVVPVPCGSYSCVTARDRLHTLRRTLDAPDFTISGTDYEADFVAAGKPLVGGNLNDDTFVDILDFGVLSFQFFMALPAHTPCGTAAPHADISGNGVVFTEDFTFVANNFLDEHEPNCCGQPLRGGPDGAGPRESILVADLPALGLAHLAVADLNDDGVIDVLDIVSFMQGERPERVRPPTREVTRRRLLSPAAGD
jgi:hypothetical protein